ncbi:hypothetical protein B6D25_08065 [Micrococcus luteus]|jgi:hypothetical protein|nr:hypothetical protein [Micrococcus luteus]ACS30554.1 hypothetical protein Mlut_10420 [Micrococcus luteus NCTC 2665]AJO55653.1 hypothetical protein BF96_05280 [Micrococcus luteus]KAB1898823.1 hypothetical protein F8198_10965 [Micrococcus luteus NCTC 2665]ORE59832.1 hypothetical protein B6D25_08065 [Micrococcus luteus]QCY45526.1 hypothetical protein ERB44_10790 [Micrococcus luteus]
MVLAIGLVVGMTGLLVGSENVVAMVFCGLGLLLLGCSFLLILVMPKASQLSGEVQWRRIVKHRLQHRLSAFRHAGREWWQAMSRPAIAGGTAVARGRVKRHGPSLEPLLFLAIVLLAGVVALSGMLSTLVRLFDPRNGVNTAIAGTALATAWMVLLGLTLWALTVTLILAVIVGQWRPAYRAHVLSAVQATVAGTGAGAAVGICAAVMAPVGCYAVQAAGVARIWDCQTASVDLGVSHILMVSSFFSLFGFMAGSVLGTTSLMAWRGRPAWTRIVYPSVYLTVWGLVLATASPRSILEAISQESVSTGVPDMSLTRDQRFGQAGGDAWRVAVVEMKEAGAWPVAPEAGALWWWSAGVVVLALVYQVRAEVL